jgi:hypothetical protein
MGSAMMVFESIVILLAIPVAVVVEHKSHATALGVAALLVLLCIAAAGRMRGPRREAVATGSVVQLAVLASGYWVHAMLVPGVIFMVVWVLAVALSAKTDLAKPLN